MTEYDIQLENVTKDFDDLRAVNNVSIDIEKGEFLTLLGPSGCGKTTTLRMIAGLETLSEGDIYINNSRVNDIPPFERDAGMVFQSYALFPHMTVGENIAFGYQMERSASQTADSDSRLKRLLSRSWSEELDTKVDRMLELVELPEMRDRKPTELSGGQQQRVALARALITEPTVLLLDEPLGALDLQLRQNMQIELKNLQEELGTTFVYVTHDQEEALTMSDRIVVMNDGQVEQIGTASEIYEEPKSEFVADFIGETNLIRGSYSTDEDGAVIQNDGLTYRVPETDGASGTVSFAIRPEKVHVGDEVEGLANQFTAEVVDEIYKGNLGKFVLQLENGQELTVDIQIADQEDYLTIGSDVRIGWEPENTVVLTQ